jgi:hypothetical protein
LASCEKPFRLNKTKATTVNNFNFIVDLLFY